MSSQQPKFRFRPHHFLCSVGYRGEGYSPDFTQNFSDLVRQLRGEGGDELIIEVVGLTDDICGPCPHRKEDQCSNQSKIDRLDQAHAQVLGLKPGDRLTWGEAKQRIRQRMSMADHERVCDSCEWRPLGICAEALQRLHHKNEN